MKMVNDTMPRHSTSVNNLEENYVPKYDNVTDVDKSKGVYKIFPGDLCDSECDNKDTIAVPMNENMITNSPGDECADVEESQTEADVKDICVDEGSPVKDKILVGDTTEEGLKCVNENSNTNKDTGFGSNDVIVDVEWPVPVGMKAVTEGTCEKDFNSCEAKLLILHTVHSESESEAMNFVSSDLVKEKIVDMISLEETNAQEIRSETSMENSCKDQQDVRHGKSIADCEVATDKLICSNSTPETLFKETADADRVETSNMKMEPALEATNNDEVELPTNASHPHQTPDTSRPTEHQMLVALENLTASARFQRDNFESSFASVGRYSSSIAYSGTIAYSGSLSHRSDASTVSTRSFAFPVLQNEWNFSPLRMRKADRRGLRRHRGWMNGLFCCHR